MFGRLAPLVRPTQIPSELRVVPRQFRDRHAGGVDVFGMLAPELIDLGVLGGDLGGSLMMKGGQRCQFRLQRGGGFGGVRVGGEGLSERATQCVSKRL